MAQDALEGKTCLHWAAGSDTPSAANCVQLIAKKYRNLVETKVGRVLLNHLPETNLTTLGYSEY